MRELIENNIVLQYRGSETSKSIVGTPIMKKMIEISILISSLFTLQVSVDSQVNTVMETTAAAVAYVYIRLS